MPVNFSAYFENLKIRKEILALLRPILTRKYLNLKPTCISRLKCRIKNKTQDGMNLKVAKKNIFY